MPGNIRVAIFQFSPIFGSVTENVARCLEKLATVEANIAVLPELCTTGYQFVSKEEVRSLSETVTRSYAVERFGELARAKRMGIVFGMAEACGDSLFNSAVYMGPTGFVGVYRKAHLFFEEKFFFDYGKEGFPVFEQGGFRIGVMICYDWAFPEAARVLALKGADLICHPSNLVLPFCQAAMMTRCIENGVFAATANRTGHEARGGKERLVFSGASQVVDTKGNLLLRLDGEEALGTVAIDPLQARNKQLTIYNDLLKDRAPELYGTIVEG